MEIVRGLFTSISIAGDLYRLAEQARDLEAKKLVAELQNSLTETKIQVTELTHENRLLKAENDKLRGAAKTGEICPRCNAPTFVVERSAPDSVFGELGVNRRHYVCQSCHFKESRPDS